MRGLRLAQERRLVEEVLARPDALAAPAADLDAAELDQLRAAAAEVRSRVLGTLRRHTGGIPRALAPSERIRRLSLVAVIRCLCGSRCAHVTASPLPLLAVLPARVVTCERCLATRYRGALAAAERRAESGQDSYCDLCLQDVAASTELTALYLGVGPILLVGAVCAACATELRSGVEG